MTKPLMTRLETLQRIADAVDPDGGPLEPEHYDALAEAVEGLVSDARGRQPDPTPGVGDVWAELIDAEPDDDLRALMVERRALGIARYGLPLQRANGRDTHRDLREELLDAMAYAQAERLTHLVGSLRSCLLAYCPVDPSTTLEARVVALERRLESPAWLAAIVGAVALVWAVVAAMLPGVL